MIKSIGCEMQPNAKESLYSLKDNGITHLQITVPNKIAFEEVLLVSKEIPMIVHSNVLNIFGDNNWDELQEIAKQIVSLNPIHIVEHFTALRPNDFEKTGVSFNKDISENQKLKAIENIKRWQAILSIPVCIENIPLVEDIDTYFNFMLEVQKITKCEITCDVPHFLLSMFSAKKSTEEICEIAKKLNPIHVHLGGLTYSDGMLRDNHNTISPWITSFAREHFKEVKFLTFEQSYKVPVGTILQTIAKIESDEYFEIPEAVRTLSGISADEVNHDLCEQTSKDHGLKVAENFSRKVAQSVLKNESDCLTLFDRYLPFAVAIEPIEIALQQNRMSAFEAIKSIASLCRFSLSYLSWFYPKMPRYVVLSYGEADKKIFTEVINEQRTGLDANIVYKKFVSPSGFWVEVAAPQIPNSNTCNMRSLYESA